MDTVACNYNQEATVDDESCIFSIEYYNCEGNCNNDIDNDNICDELEIFGCTDNGLQENAVGIINDQDGDELPSFNYNPDATQDDESCITIIEGCTEEGNYNYNSQANTSSDCIPFIEGCADSTKFNYNPAVNDTNNIYCYDFVYGCMIEAAFNFNNYGTNYLLGQDLTGIDGVDVNTSDGSCIPRIFGCTDPLAMNYDQPVGDPLIDVNTDNGLSLIHISSPRDS